jgi:hypothetical protein
MEEGFVLDALKAVSTWVKGAPEIRDRRATLMEEK